MLSIFLPRHDDAMAPSSMTEVCHCFPHYICLCPDIQDFFFIATPSTAVHPHLVPNTAKNLTERLKNLYKSRWFEKPENQAS